ncbi:hypothetical protein [Pseudorhodoferax sp. Leaf267]|uniref:hypothetical protein n=1 Tax=Pseudorhodoferax sp. Leaf267 TaxID=1736316 RepID=UPI0006F9E015|nr:hypothetical protein [Pseudorhodoferax sp. Leaf267]KQP17686.1 hypothetical protein ASF43_07305 [Pseudorhodoferax sp. Leaf267]
MNKPVFSKPPAPATGGPAAAPTEWKRKPQLLDDELQSFTLLWLKSLPREIRPFKCAQHYPRVVNKIAALWSLEERCVDYLDELLADQRDGSRQGFGYGIPGELRLLRNHRAAEQPKESDAPVDFQPTVPMALDPPPDS